MGDRSLVWKVTADYEHFGCTDCQWKPSEPQNGQIAKLEFGKHICAEYPGRRAAFA
jgi:hypothetical protein